MDDLRPSIESFEKFVGNSIRGDLRQALEKTLVEPSRDILTRPSKRLRGKLVQIAFEIARASQTSNESSSQVAQEVVELLHAGSLVIDDIEDQSAMRRGDKSLHAKYGVPIALNTGNFLYFWTLETASKIAAFDSKKFLSLYRDTMVKAHLGQAMDVGIAIDEVKKEEVTEVCLTSLKLKSGSLTGFAFSVGALCGNANADLLAAVESFGEQFGIALQMYDDIGNAVGQKLSDKRWEDLKLRRPTWLWATMAKELNTSEYEKFIEVVRSLPEEEPLLFWLRDQSSLIQKAKHRADEFLTSSLKSFRQSIAAMVGGKGQLKESLRSLESLTDKLRASYD